MASNPLGPGNRALTKVVIKSSATNVSSVINPYSGNTRKPYRDTDDWKLGNLVFIESNNLGGTRINPMNFPDSSQIFADHTNNIYSVNFDNGFSLSATTHETLSDNGSHPGNLILGRRMDENGNSTIGLNNGTIWDGNTNFDIRIFVDRATEFTITLPPGTYINAIMYRPSGIGQTYHNYYTQFDFYFDNESTPSSTYDLVAPLGPDFAGNAQEFKDTTGDEDTLLILSNGQVSTTLLNEYINTLYNNGNTTSFQEALTNKTEVNNFTAFTPLLHQTLSINCFLKGTMIETMKGILPVEDLRPNMFVKTYNHSFVPIKLIGKMTMPHNSKDKRNKNQLFVCKKEVYPEATDDLVITGCHSLLVDRDITDKDEEQRIIDANGDIFLTDNLVRIPAVADLQTIIYPEDGDHEIYHFSLDHHDEEMNYGVYANGILVETCSNRMMKEYSGMTFLE